MCAGPLGAIIWGMQNVRLVLWEVAAAGQAAVLEKRTTPFPSQQTPAIVRLATDQLNPAWVGPGKLSAAGPFTCLHTLLSFHLGHSAAAVAPPGLVLGLNPLKLRATFLSLGREVCYLYEGIPESALHALTALWLTLMTRIERQAREIARRKFMCCSAARKRFSEGETSDQQEGGRVDSSSGK